MSDTGGKPKSKVPATSDPTTLAWVGVAVTGAASTLIGRTLRRRED